MADINSDIITLADWFRANKLSLNVHKTNFMILKTKSNANVPYSVKIGNEEIKKNCQSQVFMSNYR